MKTRAPARGGESPRQTGHEPRKLRILHVITGLNTGGAEMMLVKLLGEADRGAFDMQVVSLMDAGSLGARLTAQGITLHSLGLARGRASLRGLRRLRAVVRAFQPDLIQGWMYHGNLAASIAAAGHGRPIPVAWNVRQTVYRLRDNGVMTSLLILAGALLSRTVQAIIYNSTLSQKQHQRLGYSSASALLIPNGFDSTQFRPDPAAYSALRSRLGVRATTRLVGMVARFHAMKDFPTMFRCATLVTANHPDAEFVFAGRGVTEENAELRPLLAALPPGRVHLLGEVHDVPALMAGLDVVCSSSAWGEGFPNVLGESMAAGVPCVATDVGDSARVIGDAGIVVPARDPAALAQGVSRLLELPEDERLRLSLAARARVVSRFSIALVAGEYEELYSRLVPQKTGPLPDRVARRAADKVFS